MPTYKDLSPKQELILNALAKGNDTNKSIADYLDKQPYYVSEGIKALMTKNLVKVILNPARMSSNIYSLTIEGLNKVDLME